MPSRSVSQKLPFHQPDYYKGSQSTAGSVTGATAGIGMFAFRPQFKAARQCLSQSHLRCQLDTWHGKRCVGAEQQRELGGLWAAALGLLETQPWVPCGSSQTNISRPEAPRHPVKYYGISENILFLSENCWFSCKMLYSVTVQLSNKLLPISFLVQF